MKLTFWLWLWLSWWCFSNSEAKKKEVAHVDDEIFIPRLGLGTAGLRTKTEWITLFALNSGVKLIDTAQAQEWYDEAAVANAVNQFLQNYPEIDSEKVFLVTKIHPRSYSLEKMRIKLKESSRNFQQRKIDVVLLHSSRCWPGGCSVEEEAVSWQEAWTNLEQLKDEVNIQMIGVSNFDLNQLKELVLHHANRKVSVIQNWMDPYHQDREVRQFAQQHGIQYMAYSSFGTQWYHTSNNPVFHSDVLKEIAAKHKSSVSQVVISWLLKENVIAIPRCSTISHLQENFKICTGKGKTVCEINGNVTESDIPVPLDAYDLQTIRSLDGSIGTPWD